MRVQLYVTNQCNLACVYCHEKKNLKKQKKLDLNIPSLRRIFESILKYARARKERSIDLHWTGGEVFSLPPNRLRAFFDLQRDFFPKRYRIKNTIQTNLYRLTPGHLDMLREYRNTIDIGVSFDFTEETRPTPDGRPSQKRVFRNLAKLRMNGIPFGIICVISRYNVGHMEEIYDWMVENEIDFHFNPIKRVAYARDRKYIIEPAEYAASLLKVIKKYTLDTKTKIRFANALGHSDLVLGGGGANVMCSLANECSHAFIMINPDGDVYPCIALNLPSFLLGNCFKEDLNDIVDHNNPVLIELENRKTTLRKRRCGRCKWHEICSGGCSREAFDECGTINSPSSITCQTHKYLFPRLTKFLPRYCRTASTIIVPANKGIATLPLSRSQNTT